MEWKERRSIRNLCGKKEFCFVATFLYFFLHASLGTIYLQQCGSDSMVPVFSFQASCHVRGHQHEHASVSTESVCLARGLCRNAGTAGATGSPLLSSFGDAGVALPPLGVDVLTSSPVFCCK